MRLIFRDLGEIVFALRNCGTMQHSRDERYQEKTVFFAGPGRAAHRDGSKPHAQQLPDGSECKTGLLINFQPWTEAGQNGKARWVFGKSACESDGFPRSVNAWVFQEISA